MTTKSESMADISKWAQERIRTARKARETLSQLQDHNFVQQGGGIGAGAGIAHKAHLDAMKDKAANPGSDDAGQYEAQTSTSENKKEIDTQTTQHFGKWGLPGAKKVVKDVKTTEDVTKTSAQDKKQVVDKLHDDGDDGDINKIIEKTSAKAAAKQTAAMTMLDPVMWDPIYAFPQILEARLKEIHKGLSGLRKAPTWIKGLTDLFLLDEYVAEFLGKIAGATFADQTFQDMIANMVKGLLTTWAANKLQGGMGEIISSMSKSGMSPSADMAAIEEMETQMAAGGVQAPEQTETMKEKKTDKVDERAESAGRAKESAEAAHTEATKSQEKAQEAVEAAEPGTTEHTAAVATKMAADAHVASTAKAKEAAIVEDTRATKAKDRQTAKQEAEAEQQKSVFSKLSSKVKEMRGSTGEEAPVESEVLPSETEAVSPEQTTAPPEVSEVEATKPDGGDAPLSESTRSREGGEEVAPDSAPAQEQAPTSDVGGEEVGPDSAPAQDGATTQETQEQAPQGEPAEAAGPEQAPKTAVETAQEKVDTQAQEVADKKAEADQKDQAVTDAEDNHKALNAKLNKINSRIAEIKTSKDPNAVMSMQAAKAEAHGMRTQIAANRSAIDAAKTSASDAHASHEAAAAEHQTATEELGTAQKAAAEQGAPAETPAVAAPATAAPAVDAAAPAVAAPADTTATAAATAAPEPAKKLTKSQKRNQKKKLNRTKKKTAKAAEVMETTEGVAPEQGPPAESSAVSAPPAVKPEPAASEADTTAKPDTSAEPSTSKAGTSAEVTSAEPSTSEADTSKVEPTKAEPSEKVSEQPMPPAESGADSQPASAELKGEERDARIDELRALRKSKEITAEDDAELNFHENNEAAEGAAAELANANNALTAANNKVTGEASKKEPLALKERNGRELKRAQKRVDEAKEAKEEADRDAKEASDIHKGITPEIVSSSDPLDGSTSSVHESMEQTRNQFKEFQNDPEAAFRRQSEDNDAALRRQADQISGSDGAPQPHDAAVESAPEVKASQKRLDEAKAKVARTAAEAKDKTDLRDAAVNDPTSSALERGRLGQEAVQSTLDATDARIAETSARVDHRSTKLQVKNRLADADAAAAKPPPVAPEVVQGDQPVSSSAQERAEVEQRAAEAASAAQISRADQAADAAKGRATQEAQSEQLAQAPTPASVSASVAASADVSVAETLANKDAANKRVAAGEQVKSLGETAKKTTDDAAAAKAAHDNATAATLGTGIATKVVAANLTAMGPDGAQMADAVTRGMKPATPDVKATKAEMESTAKAADAANAEYAAAAEQHGFTDEGHQADTAKAERANEEHNMALKHASLVDGSSLVAPPGAPLSGEEAGVSSTDPKAATPATDAQRPDDTHWVGLPPTDVATLAAEKGTQQAKNQISLERGDALSAMPRMNEAMSKARQAGRDYARTGVDYARAGVDYATSGEMGSDLATHAEDLKRAHHEAQLEKIKSLGRKRLFIQETAKNHCWERLPIAFAQWGDLSEENRNKLVKTCTAEMMKNKRLENLGSQEWIDIVKRIPGLENTVEEMAGKSHPQDAGDGGGGGAEPLGGRDLRNTAVATPVHQEAELHNTPIAQPVMEDAQQLTGGRRGSRKSKSQGKNTSRKHKSNKSGMRKGNRSGKRRSAKKHMSPPGGLDNRRTMKRKGAIARKPRRRKCAPFTESDCTF